MSDTPPDTAAWHGLGSDAVLARLDTTEHGLADEQVHSRLARYGYNRLPPPERTGPLKRFLLQFHNVLIYVLIGAAVGTAILEHWVDTGVILGVVLINAIIGFIQEGKAEQALDAIRNMLSPKALVLRDGQRRTIPAEELVPGDIVFLQAGDKVPADLRLSVSTTCVSTRRCSPASPAPWTSEASPSTSIRTWAIVPAWPSPAPWWPSARGAV
jgi:magnesium-transporting ATPase (P-type)